MDTRVVLITERFYNSKGIHIVTWGIYIDGSFNVGFFSFQCLSLVCTLLASDDPP